MELKKDETKKVETKKEETKKEETKKEEIKKEETKKEETKKEETKKEELIKKKKEEKKEKKEKKIEKAKVRLYRFLSGENFRGKMINFCNENCDSFTRKEENTHEQGKLFEDFRKIINDSLEEFCKEKKISDDIFLEAVEKGINDDKKEIKDHFLRLNSINSFNYFKDLMIKTLDYNEEKRRKKEEEERIKREKEEEERKRKEEEERLRKLKEEEER